MRKLKLFCQKTCWLPTWQGWLLILLAAAALVTVAGRAVMPFLSPTQPVQGKFLLVEGWAPDYALEEAIRVFRNGGYSKLIVTGTDIEQGKQLAVEKTYAQLAASTLKHLGFEEERLLVLPSPKVIRDRNFTTAPEVKKWLRTNNSLDAVDVFTMAPHSRRTWLLYRLAIGDSNKIGVISITSRDYDPAHWWRSSQGFRETIDETVALIYAKFLFRPKAP